MKILLDITLIYLMIGATLGIVSFITLSIMLIKREKDYESYITKQIDEEFERKEPRI